MADEPQPLPAPSCGECVELKTYVSDDGTHLLVEWPDPVVVYQPINPLVGVKYTFEYTNAPGPLRRFLRKWRPPLSLFLCLLAVPLAIGSFFLPPLVGIPLAVTSVVLSVVSFETWKRRGGE